MKKYKDIWAVSFLVVAVTTVILALCELADADLPDSLTRILGVLDLAGVAALAYASVKLNIWKKDGEE